MAESKKRIALKPHMKQIREWVDQGKADDWIADALGTSASSVQSFRSRNDIYRRERSRSEPESVFEGVLDHGERDGWGLWFDPSVAEDPTWKEHWAGVEAVVVKIAEDSIVLEADAGDGSQDGSAPAFVLSGPIRPSEPVAPDGFAADPDISPDGVDDASDGSAANGTALRERGRVKWFDSDKGYGFLVRPTGEDLFVHNSEVKGDPSSLEQGGEVEYEVGRNDRGANARSVRLLG
ncbi:MAG: cold shock domain-containing protein [Actinomycetota bacterium]|nr:cold shock domain-containing protein [Actinomycetota bacterium]